MGLAVGNVGAFGHISISISAMHWFICRRSLSFDAVSDRVGRFGSGSGSGVERYRATSCAQSVYPARYLLTSASSRFLCLWKCLTVSSRISAFSNLECFVWPSCPLVFFLVDSSMRAFSMLRLWLILARLRFSMSGLFVRLTPSCVELTFWVELTNPMFLLFAFTNGRVDAVGWGGVIPEIWKGLVIACKFHV